MTVCEREVQTTSTARLLETGTDSVLIWIDGPFETRSFEIPTEDADTFSGFQKLDCRAIIFRCDRGGGRLRVLYPTDTGDEVVVRYDLRELDQYSHNDEATIASVRHSRDPMTDEEIARRWTVLWEATEENDG
jgi:hypothetical protein